MSRLRFTVAVAKTLGRVASRRAVAGPKHPAWSLKYEAAVELLRQGGARLDGRPVSVVRKSLPVSGVPRTMRKDVTLVRDALGGRPVERVTPVGWREARGTVLYLHGGGYAIGSPGTHRGMGCALAKFSGAEVHMLDYRLAPEHPFPAALEDAYAAYVELGGLDGRRIVLGGDSAGGGLSMALVQRLREQGAAPVGQVLFSPWMDLTRSTASIEENAEFDYLQPAQLERYASWYLQGHDPRDPRVSPRFVNPGGLPPTWVAWGELELMRDEISMFAESASAAGVEVETWVGAGMVHMWQAFATVSPDARRSVRRAAAWIQERLRRENDA